MDNVFVDTNVLVYAFDGGDLTKQRTAQAVLEGPDVLVVSTQVLLEFFVAVTRKLNPPVPVDIARAAVAEFAHLHVVTADASLVKRAVDTSIANALSVWDAMIIEAAVEANCSAVITEDLASGSAIRDVEIINPFGS